MSVPLPGSMYARASCAKANSSSNANANCCIGNKFLGPAAFRFSCGSRISSDRPRYLAIKVTPSWLAWTPVPSGADIDSPWYTKSRERFSGSLTAYARIPGAAQGSALGSAARHPLENRAEKYIDDNLANGRAGQNAAHLTVTGSRYKDSFGRAALYPADLRRSGVSIPGATKRALLPSLSPYGGLDRDHDPAST